jgi:hypothetical protein
MSNNDWKPADRHCPKCDEPTLEYRVVESSCGGYEDVNYCCRTCRHEWWIDGDDG